MWRLMMCQRIKINFTEKNKYKKCGVDRFIWMPSFLAAEKINQTVVYKVTRTAKAARLIN